MNINQLNKVLIIGQHLTSRTEAVRDYLFSRGHDVSVIGLESAFVKKKRLPLILVFSSYVIQTIISILTFRKRFDCCIGISHFSGLMGVVLNKIGICRKSVYYCIDYYKGESLFIKMENAIDRWVVLHSDEVWDISSRIKEGREQFNKLKYNVYESKHRIVPLGYDPAFFRNKEMKDIERYSIVFIGVIVDGQGLELVLEVLPSLIKSFPKVNVRVIGRGPFLKSFKRKVGEQKMNNYFEFYGFIEDENKMLDVVSSSAIGISLWNNASDKALNAYYGDPGKTKLYSVCSLPVIVSDFTVYSEIVTKYKAGIAIKYDKKALVNAIKELFLNDSLYKEYKSNAVLNANNYCNSQKIFSDILS